MAKKKWTFEEHILAFNLYCKVPFSKINSKYPPVIELAKIISRSNGAVAMKLANFARLDPALRARNISGLSRGAKGEEEVWRKFRNNWEELSFQSEKLIASKFGKKVEDTLAKEFQLDVKNLSGEEKKVLTKQRVNQSFFRKIVLASYNNTCCITGINCIQLLVASHIIPWSKKKESRMDPENGLCLNAFHDRAFDRGLLTITPEYEIIFSTILLNEKSTRERRNELVKPFHERKILMPQRFWPNKEYLEYHNKNIFMH